MIVCSKCSKQLEDGSKFCEHCGTPVQETIFCSNCGKQASTGFAFCENCGTPLAGDVKPADKQPVKKSAVKWPLFAGIGVIAVAAVVVLALFLLGGKGGIKNYGLYFKDKEIFCTNFSKADPWQLTSRFLYQVSDDSNEDIADAAYYIGRFIELSNDGKIMFFPDRIDENDSGFTLYYRYMNKQEQEPVKVDSGVVSFTVNEAATTVTYLKDIDNTLYQYDLKTDTKEKIGEYVYGYLVSDDGRKLCHINSEGNVYIKHHGKDKEKIDSYATDLSHVSEDFKTIFYVKEGSLYRKTEGKDKEKISSDVYSVLKAYESGALYYIKTDSEQVTLKDYVLDDMKDTDASMTEPEYPTYPSWWDYDTTEEYNAAVEQYEEDYEAYQEAYYKYLDKLDRDELRESLADYTMSHSNYSLYFYDGTEEKVITDAFVYDPYSITVHDLAVDTPVIVYMAYNQSDFDKVKLSEINSIYEVEDMVEAALYSSFEKYIATGDAATVFEQESAVGFKIADDGKTIYFIDKTDEDKNFGDLYRLVVSGGKPQKPELYDSDVSIGHMNITTDGKVVYFKDVKDYKGDLYVDKTRIDYDVNVYSFEYSVDFDKITYFTDYNSDKDYGTLKVYDKGKAVKIADDVHAFVITPDGEILYLIDYSTTYYKGDLYIYRKGKSSKVDDDVVAIIPVDENKYKGFSYNDW